MKRTMLAGAALLTVAGLARVETQTPPPTSATTSANQAASASTTQAQAVIDRYCATCHNPRVKAGGLALDALPVANAAHDPQAWEKVARKLRTGMMPPAGAPRPDRTTLDALAATVENVLDRAAAAAPNPGAPALHRLNRTEYANAVRDLLDLPIDADKLLPGDTLNTLA
jgi:mono/diheme cytochrome c family protein